MLTEEEQQRWDAYLARGGNASSFADELGCNQANARKYFQKLRAKVLGPSVLDPSVENGPQRIAELLEKSGVDAGSIGHIKKAVLRSWGTGIKNADGEFEAHGLYSTAIEFEPKATETLYPVPQQATPAIVKYFTPIHIARKTKTAVILSDTQIGFLRNQDTGEIEPIHDPAAIDVAIQILASVQPNVVVQIGDLVDNAEASRWPKTPEMRGTLQLGIDEGHRFLATVKSAAGRKCEEIAVVGGNHDNRFAKRLQQEALELMGLKQAGSPKNGWPVFSTPFMLNFESLGVKFSGEFPGGEYWLSDDLVCMHAPPKKLEFQASIIHGHTHHMSQTTYAQHTRSGRVNYHVYDIACLCRVDSTLDPKRLLRTHTPSDRPRTDWSQGIAIVEMVGDFHQVTQIRISNGQAIYGGLHYTARKEALAA